MRKQIGLTLLIGLMLLAITILFSGAASIHFMTHYGFMWKEEVLEERLPLGDDLLEGARISVNGKEKSEPRLSSSRPGEIEFIWDSPVRANTLVIKEPTATVKDFDIQVNRGDEWETWYSNFQIGRFRYVLLNDRKTGEPLETKALKLRVLNADGFILDRYKIEDVSLYMVTRPMRDDFLVSVYANGGAESPEKWAEGRVARLLERETFDVINDIIFFRGIDLAPDGHLVENSSFHLSYEKVLERRRITGNKTRIRISLFMAVKEGGMGSSYAYEEAFGTAENRNNLIEDARALFQKYPEIEGIDLDWETYFTKEQLGFYRDIIVELSENFPDKVISIAAHTMPDNGLASDAVEALGNLNLMGYDNYDKYWYHMDFETTAYGMLNRALAYGYEEDQIVYGHGFFGRPDQDRWDIPQWVDHKDFSDELGWYGNIAPVREEVNGEVLDYVQYFNGPAMVADKTALVIDSGARGVFVWHYPETTEDENSLYKGIELAIKARGGK